MKVVSELRKTMFYPPSESVLNKKNAYICRLKDRPINRPTSNESHTMTARRHEPDELKKNYIP